MAYQKIREYLTKREKGLNDPFERQKPIYREIQENIIPWNGQALSGDGKDEMIDGSKKDDLILDPTATDSVDVLASGLESGMTNPSTPWFKLGFAEDAMADIPTVKDWLHQVEKSMRFIFNRSNIYQSFHHLYVEIGGFGTGAFAIFENFDTVIRCRPFTCGEYRLGLSKDLIVDTFLQFSYMTASQLISKFGKGNVSTVVLNAYNQKQETLFKVGWLVEPNDDRCEVKDFLNRPFRSIWYECNSQEQKTLATSGFNSFPVIAPRWHVVAGRTYGNGPGHKTLNAVKMLQKMEEKGLIAMDKNIDPPLVGPSALKNAIVNTMPGGITTVDEMQGTPGLRPLHEVRVDFGSYEAKHNRVQQQIRAGFYNDLFMMLANMPARSGVTATEIVERHSEKLIQLGPVFWRLKDEGLDPTIDRTFDIMIENELVPPPPEEIQGMELRVEYISPLAQAMKMVGLDNLDRFVGFVGSVAQMNPDVLDKADLDEAVNVYADMTGVPPKMVVPDEVVAGVREERAQQQNRQMMATMMKPAAETAKLMSETSTEEGSMLANLQGGQQ